MALIESKEFTVLSRRENGKAKKKAGGVGKKNNVSSKERVKVDIHVAKERKTEPKPPRENPVLCIMPSEAKIYHPAV